MTILPCKKWIKRQKMKAVLVFAMLLTFFDVLTILAYCNKAPFMRGVGIDGLIAIIVLVSISMAVAAYLAIGSINACRIVIANNILAYKSVNNFRFIDLNKGFQISRQGNFWNIVNDSGEELKVCASEYPDLKLQASKLEGEPNLNLKHNASK